MDAIDTLVAKEAIRDLAARYMRGQDRLDAALQRSVFHDDATTDYGYFRGGPDAFVAFAQGMLATHVANHHMIGQMLIDIEGDVAFGEIYFQAFHRLVEGGVGIDLFMAGRYVDRYERRDGVWKIAHRTELLDWGRKVPAADEFVATLGGALIGGRGDDFSNQRALLRAA